MKKQKKIEMIYGIIIDIHTLHLIQHKNMQKKMEKEFLVKMIGKNI
jgi:hypothetical protein